MDGSKRFGQLIERAMRRRGIAAYELAHKLGRQPSFVSRIVNGQNANPPDPQTFNELSRILKIEKLDMLQAIGYLSPDEATEGDTNVSAAAQHLHQLIDLHDWTEEEATYLGDFIEWNKQRTSR